MQAIAIPLTYKSAMVINQRGFGITNPLVQLVCVRFNKNVRMAIEPMYGVRLCEDVLKHVKNADGVEDASVVKVRDNVQFKLSRPNIANPNQFQLSAGDGVVWIHLGGATDGIEGVKEILTKLLDLFRRVQIASEKKDFELVVNIKEELFDIKNAITRWHPIPHAHYETNWVIDTHSVSNWDVRQDRVRVDIKTDKHQFSHRIALANLKGVRELLRKTFYGPIEKLDHVVFEDDLHFFVSKSRSPGLGVITQITFVDHHCTSTFCVPNTHEHYDIFMDAFTYVPEYNNSPFQQPQVKE